MTQPGSDATIDGVHYPGFRLASGNAAVPAAGFIEIDFTHSGGTTVIEY